MATRIGMTTPEGWQKWPFYNEGRGVRQEPLSTPPGDDAGNSAEDGSYVSAWQACDINAIDGRPPWKTHRHLLLEAVVRVGIQCRTELEQKEGDRGGAPAALECAV